MRAIASKENKTIACGKTNLSVEFRFACGIFALVFTYDTRFIKINA